MKRRMVVAAAASFVAAPAWVRARAVAMYLVTTQACLALGSAVWGALATAAGIREALFASAATIVVLLLLIRRYRVEMGEEADVTPLVHLPELVVATEPKPGQQSVMGRSLSMQRLNAVASATLSPFSRHSRCSIRVSVNPTAWRPTCSRASRASSGRSTWSARPLRKARPAARRPRPEHEEHGHPHG